MMSVYIAEGIYGSVHYLKKDREPLTVLGLSSFLIRQDEQWYLRLPHGLKADRRNPMTDGMTVRITDTGTKEYADLYFLQCPSGSGEYRRYHIPHDVFTVGSSIEDDICFDLPWIRSGAFMIDPKTKTIRYEQGLKIADLNGILLSSEMHYSRGDVFSCLYLKIVFHEDFMMVNGLFPMKESMVMYHVRREPISLPAKKMLKYSHDAVREIQPEVTAEVKLPQLAEDTYTSQLILSMGPALMMSSASLVSGSLNAYRNYMAGRNAIEILPSVLLPSVMVLSALLWNPLQKHSEKKQKKKQLQKKIMRLKKECEELQQQMQGHNSAYRTYAECEVLMPKMCTKEYVSGHTFFLHDSRKIMIWSGTGRGYFGLNGMPADDTDNDEIIQILNDTEAYRKKLQVPLLFDLKTYRRIVLEGDTDELFYLYAAQFCFLYEDLDLCIYCSEEYLHKHLWLYEAASIDSGGRRMLFTDQRELKQYLQ